MESRYVLDEETRTVYAIAGGKRWPLDELPIMLLQAIVRRMNETVDLDSWVASQKEF